VTGRVWYAAYGSNLLAERFQRYLDGGSYGPSGPDHAGARDSSPPAGWRSLDVPHQLRFGRRSRRWGGGVAFLDPTRGSGTAIVRCWDITVEQFADVAAQENGLGPGTLPIDVTEVTTRGAVDLTDGWYGRALYLGDLDDRPVLTFTGAVAVEPTPPGAPYLDTVARGLLETSDRDPAALVDYLQRCPGVHRQWSAASIRDLFGAGRSTGGRPGDPGR
jgi:hypothetical protein